MKSFSSSVLLMACLWLTGIAANGSAAEPLRVLFLGDQGHHEPRARFAQFEPAIAGRNVRLTYTENLADLNAPNLANYDVVALFANIDNIEPAQEQALLAYVENGGGFVPIHCATYCFRNSPAMVALMGAQFQRHGTGVFRDQIVAGDHPIMQQFGGFESWDETYVHHLHNEKDRTVLAYRVDSEGREPWTWIRTQGKGRVFYTAWGHDQRTWGNPGFVNLIERGLRWAAGQDPSQVPAYLDDLPFPLPEMTAPRTDVAPFEYVDVGAKIPNYPPSDRWGTQGDPLTRMQQPLPPAESIKHLILPKGFHAELFVSEPDLGGKPIAMTWDERGRLWVAETYDYPNELQPTGKGRDRIRICEDTDGDWRADKFTVFAEGLSIPTSLTFYRSGVIVQNSVETLYLKDTNGDDVSDERTVMFTGWNQDDTHGGVSNFQYGLDNWIYAMQGYNFSEPRIGDQKQLGFRMGFFRFRPDGSEIEFLRSTDNNTWGFGQSEEGLIFGSTANRNPSVFMPIPNRYYERVRGWTPSLTLRTIADTYLFKPVTDKVRQVDQHGGYTAGAGHALYTARNYPQEYWNRTAFVCGPTGHLVGTFVLRRDGANFKSTYSFNLAGSDDEWTAPIMAEVGPDGNVWMVDWYNFIVQHNPTPAGFQTGQGNAYESDLRDKRHGRIYRIIYDAAPAAQAKTLRDASPNEWVRTLTHPNMFWRKHAQRLLIESGSRNVVPQLAALAMDPGVDPIGLNVGAMHALWTLHGLGAMTDRTPQALAAANQALVHASAGVRRSAVQVLPHGADSVEKLLAARLLHDADSQVRLATLLALADQPPSPAGAAALAEQLADPIGVQDQVLRDALTAAAAHHGADFLRSVAQRGAMAGSATEVLQIVAEHYARGNPGMDAVSLVAGLKQADPTVAKAIISGLAGGWPDGPALEIDAAQSSDFEALMESLPVSDRGQLVRLLNRWGSSRFAKYAHEIVTQLLSQVDHDVLSVEDRLAAAKLLFEFTPESNEIVGQLLERITPQLAPELATGLIASLAFSEASDLGTQLTAKFPSLTPNGRAAAVAVLLRRKPSTEALIAAIDNGAIQLTDLSLDQRQALSNHPDRELRLAARRLLDRGGALPNADRQKVMESLVAVTEQAGDAAAGKVVFNKVCAKCHMHSGEGNRIGPDLTGMAVHPKHELLSQIIDPNRSVESNFRTYTLVTQDGLVLTGMLASESKTALELFNAEGEKKTVLREDVEELVASSKSLMPEGFEKQITEIELRDLLEFLTKRGKYVPVDLSKAATVASDRGMFNNPNDEAERLVFDDWSVKTFEGVPFYLIDPRGGRVANVILLQSPNSDLVRRLPRSAKVPAGGAVKAIHLLSGVSGWGHPIGEPESVSLIVRLLYADGESEDHPLKNGVHFADYIRVVDVPGSQLAFRLRGRQIRYLSVIPERPDAIESIEFVKGSDRSAPVVMAVTLESP